MGKHMEAWSNGNGRVEIAVYGSVTTLSLEDAQKLLVGLRDAVAQAEAIERHTREMFVKERTGT